MTTIIVGTMLKTETMRTTPSILNFASQQTAKKHLCSVVTRRTTCPCSGQVIESYWLIIPAF